MGVREVYSSPPSDDAIASVTGYVHDDGTAKVVVSPYAANGVGMTLHVHWSPAEARRVAAELVAAADATEAATPKEVR